MSEFSEAVIRTSAFVRKEIVAIIRQPRLLAILVLGPFLILLLFGVGYQDKLRTLRTVIVVPEDSHIKEEVDEILASLKGALDIQSVITSREEAVAMLDRQEIDLVMVTPVDPYSEILQNEQSLFEMVHHEIDPLEVLYVKTLERAYVREINRQVLVRAVVAAQERSGAIQEKVADAQAGATVVHADLDRGDGAAALQDTEQLLVDFQALNNSIASSLSLFEGVQSLSEEGDDSSMLVDDRLADIEQQLGDLALLDEEGTDFTAEIGHIVHVEDELAAIDAFFEKFHGMKGRVLVSPFSGATVSVTAVTLGSIDFYVPGVIALLLQHMAVTLAALSIVRERNSGTIELFRAAPVTPLETLSGKMISFMILTAVLSAILSGLVIFGLKTPMLGSWMGFTAVVLALLFTSLSMGFAISVISQTDSQAVQFSMIVLLASIFFSGFFIALHRLLPAVHIVSWMLPATYGTVLLQDVMLRGKPIDAQLIGGLLMLGSALFLFSWWRMRHLMARE